MCVVVHVSVLCCVCSPYNHNINILNPPPRPAQSSFPSPPPPPTVRPSSSASSSWRNGPLILLLLFGLLSPLLLLLCVTNISHFFCTVTRTITVFCCCCFVGRQLHYPRIIEIPNILCNLIKCIWRNASQYRPKKIHHHRMPCRFEIADRFVGPVIGDVCEGTESDTNDIQRQSATFGLDYIWNAVSCVDC